MQKEQFNSLMRGEPAKAARMTEELKKQILGRNRSGKTDEVRKFILENEQPIPQKLFEKIQRRIQKLDKKKWSDIKIQNHIKKYFKITVV